jgi:glycosyltransferase involved in cell wall biosynthesis
LTFDEEDSALPLPTEEQLAQSYVAPGMAAQFPIGITYQASWKQPADGMNKHAREQVKALATTGLPIQLQSFGERVILNDELEEEAQKVAYLAGVSFTHTAISIKQLIAFSPQQLRDVMYPVGIRNFMNAEQQKRLWASTILYTSWERDTVHKDYVEFFNKLGQVWVPCFANAQAMVDSGVSVGKVKVVPYAYHPDTAVNAAPRGREVQVSADAPRRFYTIGKWEPRKNQHNLIGAFLMAFTPKDKASLFIKTSGYGTTWSQYPTCEQSLKHWMDNEEVRARGWTKEQFDRLIRVVDKKLPESDIQQLHAKNNIYVSAGLGEAWDIPAFEAKLAGNRLVYVGYGGPEEYAEKEDVRVWKTATFSPVHPGYMWEPNARWANVLPDELAAGLKRARPRSARVVPLDYFQRFGYVNTGRLMYRYIEELARQLGCWEALSTCGGFG